MATRATNFVLAEHFYGRVARLNGKILRATLDVLIILGSVL